MKPFLSLVLPAYNEEECIEQVMTHMYSVLERSGFSFELIAVQNGSSDRTGPILAELEAKNKFLRVLEVPVNQGFGFGVIQGLKECSGDVIGYMPSDGQIPAETVPALVEKMRLERADIGKGCRVVRNDGVMRKLITLVYNAIVRILFRLPTTDVNSNPKLMTMLAYHAIQPCSHDFFIDPEILLKARKLNLTFCEVEIVSPKRPRGRSKLAVVRVGLKFLGNLLKARFMKNDPWGINSLTPSPSIQYSQR